MEGVGRVTGLRLFTPGDRPSWRNRCVQHKKKLKRKRIVYTEKKKGEGFNTSDKERVRKERSHKLRREDRRFRLSKPGEWLARVAEAVGTSSEKTLNHPEVN